ncbi:MAG: hypothetical protein GEU97_05940 [Actinophytocola sp.]|nr:hypothetical protein [Actinophytocola sp.]
MAFLTEDDEGGFRTWRSRWLGAASSPSALLVPLTALGATLIFWLVHQALIDDSYITLTYARTLAEHGEWGMLPGHEANSATSPLNVLLLGGLTVILGSPVVAAGVLYVGTCVALVLGLRGLGHATGLGDRVAVIGGPLLIASPLLAATVGLETMLVVAGMTYLAWACARGNAVMAGLAGGMLLWLRLDTLLVVVALVLATPALWRRLHVAAGARGAGRRAVRRHGDSLVARHGHQDAAAGDPGARELGHAGPVRAPRPRRRRSRRQRAGAHRGRGRRRSSPSTGWTGDVAPHWGPVPAPAAGTPPASKAPGTGTVTTSCCPTGRRGRTSPSTAAPPPTGQSPAATDRNPRRQGR